MSRCPTRKVKKRRLSHKTASLDRFNDLVYIDLRKPDTEIKPLQLDEDLPGMGQFYCLHCDVKIMNGPAPHSQLDADLAVGMAMPNNGPKLMTV